MMRKWIIIAIALHSSALFAQNNMSKSIDIGNNDDFSGFEYIDPQIAGSKLILTGELSAYSSFNSKLEQKMIRYLHSKGVKVLAQDISPSRAWIANNYINSNDSFWTSLMNTSNGSTNAEMYENLRLWNLGLPDSQRIQITGIDAERNHMQLVLALYSALPGKNIPDDIRIGVEAIQSAGKYLIEKDRILNESEENTWSWGRPSTSTMLSLFEFLRYYDSLQPQFMQWLDTGYAAVNALVQGIREYQTWRNYSSTAFKYTWREQILYLRLKETLETGQTTYLQLEQCHIAMSRREEACDFYRFSSVLHKIISSELLKKDDILSIGVFYQKRYKAMANLLKPKKDEHTFYKSEVTPLFKYVDEYSAAFANPDSFENCKLLSANYSLILLNNEYPSADEDESDTKVKSDDDENGDNAAIYLGFSAFNTSSSLKAVNLELTNAGYPAIPSLSSYGMTIHGMDANGTFQRFYVGGARDYRNNYSNFRIEYGGGFATVMKKHFKLISNVDMGYVVHHISIDTGQTGTQFITGNSMPVIYSNPAFYMGYTLHGIIDLGPFFIYGSGGGMVDFGDTRWKVNNVFTGEAGRLRNTGWTYSFGGGITIPVKWINE